MTARPPPTFWEWVSWARSLSLSPIAAEQHIGIVHGAMGGVSMAVIHGEFLFAGSDGKMRFLCPAKKHPILGPLHPKFHRDRPGLTVQAQPGPAAGDILALELVQAGEFQLLGQVIVLLKPDAQGFCVELYRLFAHVAELVVGT